MKKILRIGYHCLLLPTSANINTLLETLGGARQLERTSGPDKSRDYYQIQEPAEVRIDVVQDAQVKPKPTPKAIPAQTAGPYSGEHATTPE